MKPGPPPSPLPQTPAPPTPVKKNLPAAPPRRRISEKVSLEDQSAGKADRGMAAEGDQLGLCRASTLSLPPRGTSDSPGERPPRTKEQGQEAVAKASDPGSMPEPPRKIRQPPVPPPRRRRISQQLASGLASPSESTEPPTKEEAREKPTPGPSRGGQSPDPQTRTQSPHAQTGARPQSSPEFKGSLASLADSLGVPASATDQDSYSTSSTEEELEHFGSSGGKKKPSAVLGKARHRLSFASFTNVFHAFLSNNRKLYKKVVELAQDKASYFGNLVQDYKVYSLEMMARQTSSTEMLQEIRTMMTQLKSYLLQSTELKALVDPTLHSEEELGQSRAGGPGAGSREGRFQTIHPFRERTPLPFQLLPLGQVDGGRTPATYEAGGTSRRPLPAQVLLIFLGRRVTRSSWRQKRYKQTWLRRARAVSAGLVALRDAGPPEGTGHSPLSFCGCR